jgi:ABC-type glycerol-3-phosphate transport system substrate-binding protein
MKKISKIFILVLALSSTMFLNGCQKKCPKPTANIPGTSTFRSDCPYQDAATATGPKELNFYYIYDNSDAFQEQIQAFQSQNPGVKVKTKKFTNLDEYEDEVVNEIAQGEGPDVFMILNSWMPKHYKKLLPMPADLPVVITPDQFRQGFFQAAADDLIVDNKIYGMPLSIDNLAVYYNKAYFKDLLATTSQPGALWEDIKDEVFQLTKPNNSPERFALSGIALGRADNINSAVDILYTMMLEYGVKFYDDKEENATFAADAPSSAGVKNPGVEALTLFTSFGLPSYKNYSWNDTITGYAPQAKEVDPFIRGKVAMILGYPYLYSTLVQSIQNQQKAGGDHIDVNDIGIAPMPQLVSPTEAVQRDTLASYYPLVVARTTKYPKEAWGLAEYLTTKDSLQTYHKKTNRPTSRRDLVEDEQTDPLFGVFAYQAPFAKSFKIFDSKSYYKVFSDAIQEVVTNVATPKDALTEAQTKITCIIKKQKGLTSSDQDCNI